MIASKPAPTAPVEARFESAETAPLLDYDSTGGNGSNAALPESLFFGLTFPDVPTQAPVVEIPRQQAAVQQQERKAEETRPTAPQARMMLNQAPVRDTSANVARAKAPEEDISADLSLLYASMESPVSQMYPSLPSVAKVRQQPSTNTAPHAESTVEHAGNDTLVQELLDENAKLSREVQNLRASLKVLVDDQHPVENHQDATRTNHHVVSYDSDTSSEAEEEKTAHAAGRTGATAPTAATTNTGTQNRLKYVCCGSCSQWLQAPIDKTFVYCPQCGSVNDCSSVERQNEERQRQAQPARRLPTMPWYEQCFVRLSQLGR